MDAWLAFKGEKVLHDFTENYSHHKNSTSAKQISIIYDHVTISLPPYTTLHPVN